MSSPNPNNRPEKALVRPSTKSEYDDKPLWNHVTVVKLSSGGGGNRTWTCNYCSKKVTGSYSMVKAHLLQLPNFGVDRCKGVTKDTLAVIKQEHEQAEFKKSHHDYVATKQAEYMSLSHHKKRKGQVVGGLEKSFNVMHRDKADKEAARMFYASALTFNLAKNPYFIQYSRTLANNNLAGYVPPTYNRLRTTLLAQEKEHVLKKL